MDNLILQTVQKDNTLLLTMSTVHRPSTTENTTVWLRKCLGTASTSAKTAKNAFKGNNVMPME